MSTKLSWKMRHRWCRNVGDYQSTLRSILEERKPEIKHLRRLTSPLSLLLGGIMFRFLAACPGTLLEILVSYCVMWEGPR